MMEPNAVANRINWIDWAKAIAITFVVFGHTPEERGSFLLNFIVMFHMPLFFFISGYLTKKEYFNKETFKKYTHTLIIPYFIYNIITYPFWVFRHIIESPNDVWLEFVKPILGTIFIQQTTFCSKPLNGVTWFLVALLIMKVILSFCNKYEFGKYILFIVSVICIISYIYNEFYKFTTDLVPIGFAKCMPFYLIGYLCKRREYLPTTYHKSDGIIFILCFTISILFYNFNRNNFSLSTYGYLFWTICIFAIWGFFCLCRILDHIHTKFILTISIGTIVIMGLHGTVITITNLIFSKLLNVSGITYPWYVAVLISIAIVTIFYPVIILFKKKYPIMLGKNSLNF